VKQGYLFKRGSVWYWRREVSGKRSTVSLGVTLKPDAIKERDKLLSEEKRQAVDRGRLTAGAAWGVFSLSLCRRQCSDSTLKGYRAQWERFALKLTDSQDLATVTREQVSAYLSALRGAVGPNTWNKHVGCLRYVWKVIQLDTGATLPDVFLGIQALPVPVVRHEAFTSAQIQALYDAADGEMRDIIAVAAHTGLRRVDCVSLRKDALDPLTGLIRLQPQKTARMSCEAVIAASALVLDVWGARMDVCSPYLFPEAQSVLSACPQTWGARFQRFMVKTLDLPSGSGLYGLHSLRHWFKSELTDSGVPESIINVMMCHAQGSVGARYVHPSNEKLKEAISKLPDFREQGIVDRASIAA